MAKKNNTANEPVSKYKLLSAYGGPGSIVHTQYGSIIISCIEEWGFLKKVLDIEKEVPESTPADELRKYVIDQSRLERNGNIGISNDNRLLKALQLRIKTPYLKYLVLVPDIELFTYNNKIKSGVENAIPSTYMPKVFADNSNNYKMYNSWYQKWISRKDSNGDIIDRYGDFFHPSKYVINEEKNWTVSLKQDNLILLCEHGHLSDFPWSKFLRWRIDNPKAIFDDGLANIFENQNCCDNPSIKITLNTGNASGFDGKFLRCTNPGCLGHKGCTLKGLMSVKIKCPGHKPWEVDTGYSQYYSGDNNARNQNPRSETCDFDKPMTVALTTGNNLYYSRFMSSIYLHSELFESEITLKIKNLKEKLRLAKEEDDFNKCQEINLIIKELVASIPKDDEREIPDSERDMIFRFNEFQAFHKDEDLLNKYPKDLKVKVVNDNLDEETKIYFDRVLRLDNMKITSAQLDFSRVYPIDADAVNAHPKNIFRSKKEDVFVYPVVENFGEGIFFSFRNEVINAFSKNCNLIEGLNNQLAGLVEGSNDFNKGAVDFANKMNWPLYLVHTFSHLIMRELEFRCGYPTASLSERIYVSSHEEYKMFGCLIYTAEGAEGSMGGVIAQTRRHNLNNLIKSAIKRATICNSDPLCWESEGQGLFDLNFASCFSCSLVSETSCEHRNLYLDRKILVDYENGFFKELLWDI